MGANHPPSGRAARNRATTPPARTPSTPVAGLVEPRGRDSHSAPVDPSVPEVSTGDGLVCAVDGEATDPEGRARLTGRPAGAPASTRRCGLPRIDGAAGRTSTASSRTTGHVMPRPPAAAPRCLTATPSHTDDPPLHRRQHAAHRRVVPGGQSAELTPHPSQWPLGPPPAAHPAPCDPSGRAAGVARTVAAHRAVRARRDGSGNAVDGRGVAGGRRPRPVRHGHPAPAARVDRLHLAGQRHGLFELEPETVGELDGLDHLAAVVV